MEQTAVDYLIQEIKNDVFVHSKSTKEWNVIFKQAKAMYEQAIINAQGDGYNEGLYDGMYRNV
jgi:hypothetical protein